MNHTYLIAANLIVFAIALVNIATDTRLPSVAYAGIVLLQMASLIAHLRSRNFVSAALASTITVVLALAVLLEFSERIKFSPWFSATVYKGPLIGEAYAVLLMSGSLLYALTFAFGPREPWKVYALPELTARGAVPLAWAFVGLGVVASYVTIRSPTVLTAAYPFFTISSQAIIESAGLQYLATVALAMSLVVAVLAYGYRSLGFVLMATTVALWVTWAFLMRGARGAALPVMVTFITIPYFFSGAVTRKAVLSFVFSVVILLLVYQLLGTFRSVAWRLGVIDGLAYSWSRGIASFWGEGAGLSSAGPTNISMLPQSYWHLLHTIDLYQEGNRLYGSTLVDLMFQAVPQFVSDYLGFKRPISESLQLSKYRLHGGGMFTLAMAYWNFGVFGVLGAVTLLATLANSLEWWIRRQSPLLLGAYFAAAGTLPYSMFYGWQSLARGVEIVVVFALLVTLALRTNARYAESGARYSQDVSPWP